MIRHALTAAAVAATTLALAGCEAQSADQQIADQAAHRLGQVRSACDEHGNRVYVSLYDSGALAVVGADPTCVGTPVRTPVRFLDR